MLCSYLGMLPDVDNAPRENVISKLVAAGGLTVSGLIDLFREPYCRHSFQRIVNCAKAGYLLVHAYSMYSLST